MVLRPLALTALTSRSFATAAMSGAPFYGLHSTLPGGKDYSFDQLKGKVVLITNTASKCGFTPQYKGLQKLYTDYKDRGFELIGFPCNQFGGQEPGDDATVAQFCELNHGVSFPLMQKSDVNGDKTNEVFTYLKSQKSSLGMSRIKWNFEKFLISPEGKVEKRYTSVTTPEAIAADIEKLLPKSAAPKSEL